MIHMFQMNQKILLINLTILVLNDVFLHMMRLLLTLLITKTSTNKILLNSEMSPWVQKSINQIQCFWKFWILVEILTHGFRFFYHFWKTCFCTTFFWFFIYIFNKNVLRIFKFLTLIRQLRIRKHKNKTKPTRVTTKHCY